MNEPSPGEASPRPVEGAAAPGATPAPTPGMGAPAAAAPLSPPHPPDAPRGIGYRPIQARSPKIWGPGLPGKRRLIVPHAGWFSLTSEVDVRRLLALGAMLTFLVVYMTFGRPEYTTQASPGAETAPVGSVAVEARERGRPFQGLLESAVDRAPLDQVDTSEAYRSLVWNLKLLTVAEVASRAETVEPAELLRAPDQYRGQFVHMTGVLVAPLALRRLTKNEAGIDTAWSGILVDTSGTDEAAVAFDLFDKPTAEPDPRTQAVELDGVFLQVVSYENRGGHTKYVPFLQAKGLTVITGSRLSPLGQSAQTYFMIGAVVCLVLPIAGMAANRWFDRRRENKNGGRARRPAHCPDRCPETGSSQDRGGGCGGGARWRPRVTDRAGSERRGRGSPRDELAADRERFSARGRAAARERHARGSTSGDRTAPVSLAHRDGGRASHLRSSPCSSMKAASFSVQRR